MNDDKFKNIKVKYAVWKQLQQLRLDLNVSTINDVVEDILNEYKVQNK